MRIRRDSLAVRTLVALAVIGAAYFATFVLPGLLRDESLPDQKLHELRAALNDNLISLTSVANFTESGPSASVSLDALLVSMEESRKAVEDLINESSSDISNDAQEQVRTLLDKQQPLIAALKSRYSEVSKPIAYIPETDLGLDLGPYSQEVAARADAAKNALSGISNGPTLPADLRTSLADAASCFGRVKQHISDGNDSKVADERKKCTDSYSETRKLAIKYVVDAFNSSETKEVESLASEILKDIDNRINND